MKFHLATDENCISFNIILSAGQAHESHYASRLQDGIGVQLKNEFMKLRSKAILEDKAYSNKALRTNLKMKGIKVIIPDKSKEKTNTNGQVSFDESEFTHQ